MLFKTNSETLYNSIGSSCLIIEIPPVQSKQLHTLDLSRLTLHHRLAVAVRTSRKLQAAGLARKAYVWLALHGRSLALEVGALAVAVQTDDPQAAVLALAHKLGLAALHGWRGWRASVTGKPAACASVSSASCGAVFFIMPK